MGTSFLLCKPWLLLSYFIHPDAQPEIYSRLFHLEVTLTSRTKQDGDGKCKWQHLTQTQCSPSMPNITITFKSRRACSRNTNRHANSYANISMLTWRCWLTGGLFFPSFLSLWILLWAVDFWKSYFMKYSTFLVILTRLTWTPVTVLWNQYPLFL